MAKVKTKEGENLTPSNIRKVIDLLNPSVEGQKPITKKEACEILRIAYNTSRLEKIISDYIEHQQYVKMRRSQKRGTNADTSEIRDAVTSYLQGEGTTLIAKRLYRSHAFIKNLIEKIGVPEKPVAATEKRIVSFLPENCVAESFEKGEYVWSAAEHAIARISHEMSLEYQSSKPGITPIDYEKKYGTKCYAIYVMSPSSEDSFISGGYHSYSLAYDLGKLSHLKQYGIDFTKPF